MILNSYENDVAGECYWADDERETDVDSPIVKPNAQHQSRSKKCLEELHPGGGDRSRALMSCPTVPHRRHQVLDCHNGIAMYRVEPRQTSNHEQRIDTGACAKSRSVLRHHMLLDEYDFPHPGTPHVVASSVTSDDECKYGWLRFSVNCGSIAQLTEHRDRHQARLVQVYGHRSLDYYWVTRAFLARVVHDREVSQQRWERVALCFQMSKQGASPDEWRLLFSYNNTSGKSLRRMLFHARTGVKGAVTGCPGARRENVHTLQQHLFEMVTELYCKYGVQPPSSYHGIRSNRRYSRDLRCVMCVFFKRPLLDCIGPGHWEPCKRIGIQCEPGWKPNPAERDVLRVGLLRYAASKYLRRPAL